MTKKEKALCVIAIAELLNVVTNVMGYYVCKKSNDLSAKGLKLAEDSYRRNWSDEDEDD